ncbi:unnamed protein product [Ascophyllum nodosum]
MSSAEEEDEVSPPPPPPPVLQHQGKSGSDGSDGPGSIDRCEVVRLPDHQREPRSPSPRSHPLASESTGLSGPPLSSPGRSQATSECGGEESRELSSPTVSPDPNRRWSTVSHRGEKGKYMVMGALSNALDLAKAAVAHDEQGALPEKVLPYYKKAIRAIDTALKLLPEHVADSTEIKRHRDGYQARVDKLTLKLPKGSQQKDTRKSRQQSRVRFAQMELDPNCSTGEAEPSDPARRSYWVMRLVQTTILYGGYLTPKLYAPKEVWTQVGVKVSGFAPRVAALESILYMIIDRIKDIPKPPDAQARKEATQVMRGFREQAHKLQTDLSRQFPFVLQVDPFCLTKDMGTKRNLGRLNKAIKNIGRNVKNTAAVAVEKIGAGIQGKHDDEGLVYYKQVVSELCDECQVFDSWIVHLQDQIQKNDTEEMDELLMELHLVSSFMREVVCAMVLRDLEGLIDRYLNKMRKSFARMYWDEDYEDYDQEEETAP